MPAAQGEFPPPLFLGGLPQTVHKKHLEEWATENFGPCKKVTVKWDVIACRSRGFGFIEFESWDSHQALLEAEKPEEQHVIHGKKVAIQSFDEEASQASWSKTKFSDPPTEEELTCFVGALPAIADDEILMEFAKQFGEVESANVKVDPESGKNRGFGFIKYADPSGVEAIVKNGDDNKIDDKWVDVKQSSMKNEHSWGMGKGPKGKGKGKGGKGGKMGGWGWDDWSWMPMMMWGKGWGGGKGGKGKGKWGPY